MDTDQIELLCRSEVYAIVGAAMEVYNHFGAGFSEAICQEVMEMEFDLQGIPYERQKRMNVAYKGRPLTCQYIADLVCFGQVIVEIKSLRKTTRRDQGQLMNCLRITGLRVGLLINFGDPGRLDWQRFVV